MGFPDRLAFVPTLRGRSEKAPLRRTNRFWTGFPSMRCGLPSSGCPKRSSTAGAAGARISTPNSPSSTTSLPMPCTLPYELTRNKVPGELKKA